MTDGIENHFPEEILKELFPATRTDQFFDALYGDSAEGAYNIRLRYEGRRGDKLEFFFDLSRRPGKCLACNLTYGLPQVFDRHPVIDVAGLVDKIGRILEGKFRIRHWELGATREVTRDLHVVPLTVFLAPDSRNP